jgi:hypothetical protein
VTIDFVTGLPPTQSKKDVIWVVIDRLTKSAHFIPVNVRDSMEKLTKILYSRNSQITWGTFEYCVGPRPKVHLKVLETLLRVYRQDFEIQHYSISSN